MKERVRSAGLEVEGLAAAYDRLQVLWGVSVKVAPGELVAMVGANGAGKTTVLRSVSGLLRPRAGTVRLGTVDITSMGAERIAGLGLAHVPENRLVFPTLSVDDNLLLGGYTRRKDGFHALRRQEALNLFPRLADRLAMAAGALSGGEQQMLALARALMSEPSVIVLDEPSLGLAPKVIGEIMSALSTLREKGLAVLLVEQNVRAAFKIADRVLVMDRGRVVAEGTPADLASDERVRAAYLGGAATSSSSVQGSAPLQDGGQQLVSASEAAEAPDVGGASAQSPRE
ncbi:MAG TPA: ABC transporter ATP-binding protein [Dermatophilaceae bacterium]|nr:ABC transporter ATP-binding protein [Dermatophilaceae bacterium]